MKISLISPFQLINSDDLGDGRFAAVVAAAPSAPLGRSDAADAERPVAQDVHILRSAAVARLVLFSHLQQERRRRRGKGADSE